MCAYIHIFLALLLHAVQRRVISLLCRLVSLGQ